jgi:hypothetical protein
MTHRSFLAMALAFPAAALIVAIVNLFSPVLGNTWLSVPIGLGAVIAANGVWKLARGKASGS